MEDRSVGALWVELADEDASVYEARARHLVGRADVGAAWWGSNANPGRRDLPRTVPEFATLGLFEVGTDFPPPSSPRANSGGHLFMRTPRPGQGVLTGRATTGVLLVLISPRRPESAQDLRDWADFVHIRHIAEAAVPGYGMITPFENAAGRSPRYLHLYEMDGDDPEATFKSMTPLVQQRLGPPGTASYDNWAGHDQLRIDYVNTFRRAGSVGCLAPD